MRVLIAADRTDVSLIRPALRLFRRKKKAVDILCVAPVRGSDHNSAARSLDGQQSLSRALRIAEAVRDQLSSDLRPIRALADSGSAAVTIAERSGDYDLTVIHAKETVIRDGRNGTAELGPVARRVIAHAKGPVFIVRPYDLYSDEMVRILIAVDGSAASHRAVETIAGICDLSAAEITLMYVAETPWLGLEAEGDWITGSEEEKESSDEGLLEKEFVREGDAILEIARELVARPHLIVNTILEEGNPAGEILAEAERGRYDLVALGSTGNRDVKHRMMGSVSTRVASEAPCSILIVPEPGETG